MPINLRRVKELFNAALDLPEPADRLAFLDRECGGDRELRQRLDSLMAAHDQPASALKRPLAEKVEVVPIGTDSDETAVSQNARGRGARSEPHLPRRFSSRRLMKATSLGAA